MPNAPNFSSNAAECQVIHFMGKVGKVLKGKLKHAPALHALVLEVLLMGRCASCINRVLRVLPNFQVC